MKKTVLFCLVFLLAWPAIAAADALRIRSAAFENGAKIPPMFTCDGRDQSPPLEWSGAPAGVKSFALIVDDPDAPVGNWAHWVIYDLSAETTALSAGIRPSTKRPDGSRQGLNSWNKIGYGGPCPPSGSHRYYFRLYALDTLLNLGDGADKAAVEKAMEGHIIEKAEWMGKFR